MHFFRTIILILPLSLGVGPSLVLAGVGPENVAVIVRAGDLASQTIANHYAFFRDIPPENFIYLNYQGSELKTDVNTFRNQILTPILTELTDRKLLPQIDCIAYSSGFPTAVSYAADVPPSQRDDLKFGQASITGLTYLLNQVMSKNAASYTGLSSNQYMRLREIIDGEQHQLGVARVRELDGLVIAGGFRKIPAPVEDASSFGSHGFRSWYGWGPGGELWEAGGNQYVLSTMLGTTYGRGNTVGEILFYLQRSAMADGTMPTGTIYYMESTKARDPRVSPRQPAFATAVRLLEQLGVSAKIVKGEIPQDRPDVQGLMAGVADFNWPASGSTIRPGAICESLTSYSGMMAPTARQTPLTEFLRNGAAGSSGPVVEPYNIPNKFPHAMIQVHYARGCTLAEAFYQSLYGPYQLLIVGDPLCRPWANIPQVAVQGATAGDTLKGTVTITPSARMARGGQVDRYQLFVDGVSTAVCAEGESFELDTALYCDGYHELRVVAIEAGPIETQGRRIVPVRFDNHGKSIAFAAEPAGQVPLGAPLKLTANAPGAVGVAFYHQGRMIAKFAGPQGEATINSALLGEGPVRLSAIGWGSGDATQHVTAQPIQLTVGD